MTVTAMPSATTSPSVEDRMDLAKKANEEICALIEASKGLHQLKQLDSLQREIAMRGMLARIEQLSDIAWTVTAETPENFEELKAQVEFLGPL